MATARAEADFDHNSLEWLARRHANNAELRATSPVIWNRRHRFWFVTGHEEVAAVARDNASFTPRYGNGTEDGIDYIGIMGVPRPREMPRIGIAEADGEQHAALRRLLNPFMLPPAVAEARPFVEQATAWFLDRHIESGRMDMVRDLTNPVPAVLTMRMLGLPYDRWEHYAEAFHATAAYPRSSPEYQQAVQLMPGIISEVLETAESRRRRPGADVLSRLVTVDVDGRPLTDDEIVSVMWNLIGGGLDTTTSLTSLALHHLDSRPDLRRRLIDEPHLIVRAGEEYLRWTSVNETLTRTCTRDVVLGGQLIRRGDWVMMSWLGANFDPAVFDRPDEVDVDRAPNPHLAFGVGPHRCIGMHVARSLFQVMVSEVLRRIPNYRVDRAATRFYQGNPELFGVVEMPVTFPPGAATGVGPPF
ncbi:MAG TPA: cytochrome P450 [Acidimicrobiales bacterium]|nr:cytochrome P450 [Acidimicrobiales bacterium]